MKRISILFWLYKSKKNNQGESPLYLRITVGGKKVETATGYFIKASEWDSNKKLVKGKSDNSILINNYITVSRSKILQIENEFTLDNSNCITADLVKQRFLGLSTQRKTLLEVFDYHNDKVKAQVGNGYSIGTYKQYEVSKGKLKSFLKYSSGEEDVSLDSLSHKFVTDFETYLKNVDGLSSNSAMKKITQLKTVVHLALANEWTTKNPFGNFKCSYKNPKREVLTNEELQTLSTKDFGCDRLNYVRDIFLFCCYTGLRYSDVAKLTPANTIVGIDGKKWLTVDTTKTDERCNIPLFEQAEILIDKYKDNPVCLNRGVMFPVNSCMSSNQSELSLRECFVI
ncbi:site-specific integrase [Ferruginibacter lapsinanis]|uniref:site-specific integrase n=1 Tax=Ferruginibacter lapsinanis TaxID=563172 RepID=UPI001E3CE66E|nr:site-specific integrase [Ferruginibacter lapsinanis]UEG48627.1 site-specific integrase [Ferruginibacter lapsinanis]